MKQFLTLIISAVFFTTNPAFAMNNDSFSDDEHEKSRGQTPIQMNKKIENLDDLPDAIRLYLTISAIPSIICPEPPKAFYPNPYRINGNIGYGIGWGRTKITSTTQTAPSNLEEETKKSDE